MSDTPNEREEIEALLAWYVSGDLDEHQRARVDRYLKTHPHVATSMGLGTAQLQAPASRDTPIKAAPHEALDQHHAHNLAALHPDQPHTPAHTDARPVPHWLGWLKPAHVPYAVAALVVLVIAQWTIIGAYMLQPSGPAPALKPELAPAIDETMPLSSQRRPGLELLVGFAASATVKDVTTLLGSIGAEVIEGPERGLYRVHIPGQTEDDRQTVLAAFRNSGLVSIVLPTR